MFPSILLGFPAYLIAKTRRLHSSNVTNATIFPFNLAQSPNIHVCTSQAPGKIASFRTCFVQYEPNQSWVVILDCTPQTRLNISTWKISIIGLCGCQGCPTGIGGVYTGFNQGNMRHMATASGWFSRFPLPTAQTQENHESPWACPAWCSQTIVCAARRIGGWRRLSGRTEVHQEGRLSV